MLLALKNAFLLRILQVSQINQVRSRLLIIFEWRLFGSRTIDLSFKYITGKFSHTKKIIDIPTPSNTRIEYVSMVFKSNATVGKSQTSYKHINTCNKWKLWSSLSTIVICFESVFVETYRKRESNSAVSDNGRKSNYRWDRRDDVTSECGLSFDCLKVGVCDVYEPPLHDDGNECERRTAVVGHGRISVFEPNGGAICARRRQPLISRSDDHTSTRVLGGTRRFRVEIRGRSTNMFETIILRRISDEIFGQNHFSLSRTRHWNPPENCHCRRRIINRFSSTRLERFWRRMDFRGRSSSFRATEFPRTKTDCDVQITKFYQKPVWNTNGCECEDGRQKSPQYR